MVHESPAFVRAERQALLSAALHLGGVVEGKRVLYTRDGEEFECYLLEHSDSLNFRKRIRHIETGVYVCGFETWIELSFRLDRCLASSLQ